MRDVKNTVYFGGTHNAVGNAPMQIAFHHISGVKARSGHQQKPIMSESAT